MTNELAPTVALGLGASLLVFELFAALASLLEASGTGRSARAWSAPRPRNPWPVRFAPRVAIRAHLAVTRDPINALRRQYPSLRSPAHGRELRATIRRRHRQPSWSAPPGLVPEWTPDHLVPDVGQTASATVGRQPPLASPVALSA